MKQRLSAFLTFVVVSLVLAACGGATPAAAPTAAPAAPAAAPTTAPAAAGGEILRIVSSLPRQGASKGQTDAVVNAIKMRLEEDNFQACGGKFKIDYQDLDDSTAAAGKWDAATETANANKAVGDPDVIAYLGTFNSGAAKLSMPILNTANLVMISPANTYTGLTKPGKGEAGEPDKYSPSGKKNYTRVVTADDVQGDAAAKWALALGAKNVYILDDQEVYGKGVADVFEASAKTIGLNVLGRDGIDGKAQNYSSLMIKIASQNPDLVFFGGIVDNNAGQLIKDLRAAGMTPDKVKFMGPDGIQTDSFITAAGADVSEGVYATIAGLPSEKLGDKGKNFYANYEKKFGLKAESYGIYGYEAANVALAAINKACAKDRAAIRDAVFAVKDFDGALGKWSFDANGDTTLADIQGFVVKGGKWEAANLFTSGKWEK
ncbi:MAG: branched-chain amino acid ABC transporter substrate-binding protein [Roseiflexaceae bacterium]|nr:branched-chain amino acid ABC transporter substrate-binding protein [Roseiflexaceae bacterium]